MTALKQIRLYAVVMIVLAGSARGQEPTLDRVTVPLSDPTRPVLLKAGLMNGGITVKAHSGKEVIVEARPRAETRSRKDKSKDKFETSGKAAGMRRLDVTATGLTVEEEDNKVRVEISSMNHTIDLVIQVPVRTSLQLSCLNDGDIKVEGVTGEIEVNNTNGAVTLTNISGSAVAHALNDDVVVTFAKVDPEKPMSFSSLNGDIDVTFPPDLRAKVSMKSDNGEIYSDFDIRLEQTTRRSEEDERKQGGKYRIRLEKGMFGTIGAGGPEIQFATFNGDIFIRKGK